MSEKASCITINCGCCGNGGIPDCGSGAENVYSIEETVCGTWIDGKPIYRKVLTIKLPTPPAEHRVNVDVADMQIDEIVHLYGGASGAYYMLASAYLSTADYFCAYYHRVSKNLVVAYSDNYIATTAYLIVEYTKQTDSAS